MSERTTIGGTVYETVGSSSSNLLLKCNGTARIQWGTKLIDLIKNGKLASGDSSAQISIVSDESEIKSDGVYVLNTEKSSQLWIRKNSTNYNFTDTELYISASTKQDITAEQQKRALENIGMYYNTLDDVRKAGVQNGLVYVLEDKTLYTISEGIISEFEAKLKTISVEKENEEGEIIDSSIKIVLSVLNTEYLVLENKRITAKQNVHIPKYLQLGSEDATPTSGYRLYFKDDESWLDIDNINVRNGIPTKEYEEVTFHDFRSLMMGNNLVPHQWYCITDFQNHWRIPALSATYDRPILVRAVSGNALYQEGCLFDDRRIIIHYDPTYTEKINCVNGFIEPARGKIVWMKDVDGNEANFDFLDYLDSSNKPLATLHYETITYNKGTADEFVKVVGFQSVFPRNSKNNKLTVHNLKGTILKDGEFDDTNTSIIDFQTPDSVPLDTTVSTVSDSLSTINMHDNVIDCYGLVVTPTCYNFYNNNIKNVGNVTFENDCINNNLQSIYSIDADVMIESLEGQVLKPVVFSQGLSNVTLKGFINSTCSGYLNSVEISTVTNSSINGDIFNSVFNIIDHSTLNASFTKCQFGNISDCTINEGYLESVTCRSDVYSITVSQETHPILYDTTKVKDVYFINGEFQVVESASASFMKGMIVMHSGITPIPDGWAVCDGKLHWYNGVLTKTPDLVNRFIKGVATVAEVKEGNNPDLNSNNEFTLTSEHLPEHSHPHVPHTHALTELIGNTDESGDLTMTLSNSTLMTDFNPGTMEVVSSIEGLGEGTVTNVEPVVYGIEGITQDIQVSGGNHTHTITINNSSISEETSTEADKEWTNKAIKIEPNYYSLIFIMKL